MLEYLARNHRQRKVWIELEPSCSFTGNVFFILSTDKEKRISRNTYVLYIVLLLRYRYDATSPTWNGTASHTPTYCQSMICHSSERKRDNRQASDYLLIYRNSSSFLLLRSNLNSSRISIIIINRIAVLAIRHLHLGYPADEFLSRNGGNHLLSDVYNFSNHIAWNVFWVQR